MLSSKEQAELLKSIIRTDSYSAQYIQNLRDLIFTIEFQFLDSLIKNRQHPELRFELEEFKKIFREEDIYKFLAKVYFNKINSSIPQDQVKYDCSLLFKKMEHQFYQHLSNLIKNKIDLIFEKLDPIKLDPFSSDFKDNTAAIIKNSPFLSNYKKLNTITQIIIDRILEEKFSPKLLESIYSSLLDSTHSRSLLNLTTSQYSSPQAKSIRSPASNPADSRAQTQPASITQLIESEIDKAFKDYDPKASNHTLIARKLIKKSPILSNFKNYPSDFQANIYKVFKRKFPDIDYLLMTENYQILSRFFESTTLKTERHSYNSKSLSRSKSPKDSVIESPQYQSITSPATLQVSGRRIINGTEKLEINDSSGISFSSFLPDLSPLSTQSPPMVIKISSASQSLSPKSVKLVFKRQ